MEKIYGTMGNNVESEGDSLAGSFGRKESISGFLTWTQSTLIWALLFFTLDAGLLARSHLDTGFSWFPCVSKQMLR